ncbi:MAG: hypothetical protein M1833_002843 [Piccolia ochrophora]|nr:MAG: hypothetical protein M1833_002843 [Piccolia ochrophora]
MSSFGGRRAPNVSQYVATLNTVPPAQDMVTHQQEGYGNLEEDLAMFTNTQFFDFDMGENGTGSPIDYTQAEQDRVRRERAAPHHTQDLKAGFMNGDYQYPGIPNYNVFEDTANLPPTLHTGSFPQQNIQAAPNAASPTTTLTSPQSPTAQSLNGHPHSPNGKLEETSRVAAEEDKRRRNTAASARFRVKKKQREQNLEKTAKEMTEKATTLEMRISQLETENKWLKNLITEKNGTKDDVADLWKKFNQTNDSLERSTNERKDGVGTPKSE